MSKSPTKMTDQELEAAIKKLAPAPRIPEPKYYKEAASLALQFVTINQCYHCGHPVVRGYMCESGSCPNPGDPGGYDARTNQQKYHFELQKRLALREQEVDLNLGSGI